MPLPASAFAPLGANPAQFNQPSDAPLPSSLSKDRYVLMVGGIAPRKGHDVLIAVWNRLFAEGIPQSYGFKLVLAGKLGKGVSRAAQLLAENFSGDTLVHLPHVDDALLAALYRNCAFTVFPSLYEGFGLPIVESFAFGKPVIASTGGAIPEVVAGFSPCLDPLDEDAWYKAMRQWIVDRTPRDYFADKIRREYRLRSWQEATRDFFAAISS
jgi:glycosyltransferase involved in cell wall biosynthesis